jgi:hypothetical protein
MNTRPIFGFLALLVSSATGASGQGLIGSAHDFSGAAWNTTGEACVVCHVPHDHGNDMGDIGLLWNHSLSEAVYDLYSSPFLVETPLQPLGPSKMCLSCHDGTVAIDGFGGMMGTEHIEGEALIGTDLARTHPVSILWTHDSAPDCENCHNPHGNGFLTSPLPFANGRVECSTCHDPHNVLPDNPGGENMLRLPIQYSQLCLHCHDK